MENTTATVSNDERFAVGLDVLRLTVMSLPQNFDHSVYVERYKAFTGLLLLPCTGPDKSSPASQG